MSANTESLRAKLAEAEAKAKQLEADLYFMQGYITAIKEQIEADEKEAEHEPTES